MKPSLVVGTVIVAITGLIGYHFVYEPHQREVQAIQNQIREEQSSQDALQDIATTLKQLEKHYKRLPTEPDTSWLVREAVKLAQETGVQFTTISQEAPRSIDQFTRLAVGVQLTATYHQLGTFLDRIEHAQSFILVERVQVSGHLDDGTNTVKIVLSTLYGPFPVTRPATTH